ncbi:DUF4349 domain-containing protein [Luteimonas arsenica]|uniref:DUF4349 domain-containing protein n=1 Tax=Luteimonas arsenica TaxID=1586242 RepID=UPI00105552AE|nr:DUF4349 domain-containing protein [Luteimonas arsenica]
MSGGRRSGTGLLHPARLGGFAACLWLLAACSEKVATLDMPAGAPPSREAAQAAADGGIASYLAYEHTVGISLAAADMAARVGALQAACNDGRFGECAVLNVWQQGGDHPGGSIGVRIVPAGVEPMIALASGGAEIGSRSTRAEDLAVAVRDNTLAQERLRKELERLNGFQARRDLAVADMIALSERLAATEAQLEAAEREAAQHRRRIDTQLLTFNFSATRSQEAQGEVSRALRDFGGILASGTAWTIRAAAFLLPVLAVFAVLVLVIRRLRRRGKR